MQKIDLDQLAALSQLSIPDHERTELQKDLEDLIAFAGKLSSVDTTGTSPAAPAANVLRKDEVRPSLPREEALANAPTTFEGFLEVPRVVE